MSNKLIPNYQKVGLTGLLLGMVALLSGCSQVPSNYSLGRASDYAVLAKSAVSTTGVTSISGDVGLSPAAATYLTGFSETQSADNQYSTSTYVTGRLYAADYGAPTPEKLTTAVSDMETAFTTGNGFAPDERELHAGDLSGKTLTAGVYYWSSGVLINTELTLSGNGSAVFVFQIAGSLTQAADIDIILSGGALASNITWIVSDTVFVGSGAHVEGTILGMTDITMGTGSSINGRLLAQTAVNLDATTIIKPN